MNDDMLGVAMRVRDKRRAQWRIERLALEATIADAIARKETLTGNYWESEWRARETLRAAEILVETIREVMAEKSLA